MNQPRPLRLRSRDHGAFRFRVRDYRTATVRDQIPWFQAYLDGGWRRVRSPSTVRPGLSMSSHPPNGSRSIRESTVITVGGGETPPERIQRFVDVRDELEPVARWVRIIPDSGRGATSNVGSLPGEEYLYRGTHGTAAERDPPGGG